MVELLPSLQEAPGLISTREEQMKHKGYSNLRLQSMLFTL